MSGDAGSLPIVISAAAEARLAAALGFDPSAAPVKSEVHRILQMQSRIASDPAARSGAGYRETPLEIVPIASGLPPAPVPNAAPPRISADSWRTAIVASMVMAVIVWAAVQVARRKPRR